MRQYGIYLKTFNRLKVLKTTIDNILQNTPQNQPLTIVCDDIESEEWVKLNYPTVRYLKFEKRLGSPGTWEKCVRDSINRKMKYTIIFEDDCFPYQAGWLEMIDDFLNVGGKNHFSLIHLLPNKPYQGIYEKGVYLINEKYYATDQMKIGKYTVLGMTMDSNPFNLINNDIFIDEQYIVDPSYSTYGFWHSDVQLRMFWKKANKFRSSCLKELENYINALDYTTPPNSRPGGISHDEKAKAIENNRKFFQRLHDQIQPLQIAKASFWENKMKMY